MKVNKHLELELTNEDPEVGRRGWWVEPFPRRETREENTMDRRTKERRLGVGCVLISRRRRRWAGAL